jgi:chromosome segregation ATPase
MADEATLTLLAQLVDRLKPIGQQAPGAPLRASDWNSLVAAIGDLARLIVARADADRALLDKSFAPANHEHGGAVLLSWLDGPTRTLIERAANGSVEQSVAIDRLAAEMRAIGEQVAALAQALQALKAGVDGVKDNDEARARQVERMQLDVETAKSLERRVGRIASNVEGFDAARRDLLAFRDSLTDANGQRLDLEALRKQAGLVEDLRARLTLADGQLASLKDLERKLARLETRDTQTRDGVKGAVRDALADATIFDSAGLVDRLSGQVRADFEPRLKGLEQGLGTLAPRVDEAATGLDGLRGAVTGVDRRVGTLAGRVEQVAAVEGRVAGLGERLAAVEGVANGVRGEVANLSALDARMRGLDERTRGLTERLTLELGRVEGRLRSVADDLDRVGRAGGPGGEFEGRISALDQRLSALQAVEGRLSGLQQQVQRQGQLLEGARAELSALGDQRAQLARLEAGLSSLQASRAATDTQLQGLLARQRDLDRAVAGLAPTPVTDRLADRVAVGGVGGISGRVIR